MSVALSGSAWVWMKHPPLYGFLIQPPVQYMLLFYSLSLDFDWPKKRIKRSLQFDEIKQRNTLFFFSILFFINMKSIISITALILMLSMMTVDTEAAPVQEASTLESGIVSSFGCFDSMTTNRSPFCDRNWSRHTI